MTYYIKLIILLIVAVAPAFAAVQGTPHDLSDATMTQTCVFCHTPHNSNTDMVPLWNRKITTYEPYTMYNSLTINASRKSFPEKRSLACLSCHDIAAGGYQPGEAVYGGDQHELFNQSGAIGNCTKCHPDGGGFSPKFNIGPDLSNDHPISIAYPTPAQDPYFNIPPNLNTGWADVPLFSGYIECSTCHNPHDNTKGFFLRKSNDGSSLCLTCHNK